VSAHRAAALGQDAASHDAVHAPSGAVDVVFVLGSLTMGGAEAQLTSVLEADPGRLARTRVAVVTLSPRRHAGIDARLAALGVPVHVVDRAASGFPGFLWRLVRCFRRLRPRVVHAFLVGSTSTWGRLAAKLAGVPHVLLSDLSLDPAPSAVQRRLDPFLHRLTTRFLPNAHAIVARLEREGAAPERIVLVRNGVDLARFDPDRVTPSRAAWGVAESAVVVGFLGMFRPEKRPDLLLDALERMAPEQRPDLVVMAGDGALMPALRARVEGDAWLREHCRLLGVVDDAPAFLAGLDLLVLPSDTEGLPNAVLEAHAMGVPVVATDVSDVRELVGDAGAVVPAGDGAALATALADWCARPATERRAAGARGRERVRGEFAMPVAAARFWAAHDDLLDGAA
jgi:glycosyltransferase involved in cell wall biosynthesis